MKQLKSEYYGGYKIIVEKNDYGTVIARAVVNPYDNRLYITAGNKTDAMNDLKKAIDLYGIKNKKIPSKQDIIKRLIKSGNNKENSIQMTNKYYDYVVRIYGGQEPTTKEMANIIRSL